MSDAYLVSIYKNMTNTDFLNITNNNLILQTANIDKLFISGNSLLNNQVVVSKTLTNTYSNYNSNLTINNNLISNQLSISNIYSSGNINILSNLSALGITVTNYSYINACTTGNILDVSNQIIVPKLYTSTICSKLLTLNLNGSVINIGNGNSIINFIGDTISENINNIYGNYKLISLNVSSTQPLIGKDRGNLSGIRIYNSTGFGYITTSTDGSAILVKAPNALQMSYMMLLDNSYNLQVSGYTTIYNTGTINSSINISGNSIINSSIFVSQNSTIPTLNINTSLIGNNSNNLNVYINRNTTVISTIFSSNLSTSNISINNQLYYTGKNCTMNSIVGQNIFTSNVNSLISFSANTLLANSSIIINNCNVSSLVNISNNYNNLNYLAPFDFINHDPYPNTSQNIHLIISKSIFKIY